MANTLKRSNPITWLIDPVQPTAADPAYRFSWSPLSWLVPLGIGAACLVITAVGWATEPKQFYFSYLIGWTFCLSLAIGGLFFVLIQHLTKARWSVVVRRIPETLIWSFPVLAILSIPILLGMHDLYHWTHHELIDPASPEYDAILAGKAGYLNQPFFLARLAIYFIVWTVIAYRLNVTSLRQDISGEAAASVDQRKTSAWGLVLMALTTAFAAFDLLMSLDPHWFSTIFGVYFFSGSFMGIMAFTILIAMALRRAGMLKETITVEHYQDLGKFLFAFIVFWAYIAFSQYMLIWYGNLPEETIWYRHRIEHGWEIHSWILLFGHFIVPFVILIARWTKRVLPVLGFMCVWMLFMHWLDFHWLVMPVLHEEATFHLLDFSSFIGLFSVMVGLVMYRLSRHSLVPEKDPRLAASLSFTSS